MLKNLSIRAWLTLMVACFAVVLVAGAGLGLLSMRAGNASLQQM
jgi:methyl-accepting chemotaxis protein I, serine sensor receptor